MTITFKVCDNLEEEEVEYYGTFDIKNFIKEELNKSIPMESFFELKDNFKNEGFNEGEIFKLACEKSKENNLNKKIKITQLFEKTKIIKTSLDHNINNNNKDNDEELKIIIGYNSFIYSAWECYNNHNHLQIRPEDVWMAIMSQFSFYINKYNKELRSRFINFQNGDDDDDDRDGENKKIIKVFTSYPILEAPFDKLTIDMADEISKNIKDPSIRDWIIPNFSTTTQSDKIVFSSVLMSTLKKDFIYKYGSKCGLPKVTLLGTVDDWIQLKERSLRLIEFNTNENLMNKWVNNYLLEILDNFIESSNGRPNKTWWNQIIDFREQSGSSVLSGWLSVFCLFQENGDFEDNAHLDCPQFYKENKWPKINCNSIPNGFVSTPIQLIDSGGIIHNSQLYSGHFASKIKDSKTIIPSLDWLIISDLDI
ncbi:hypothetical protein RB653_009100 [Dictyostelium firmibasis]|uniref:Uncharacterized protein n=1 Tax=Dictyostelium firmibasis TaxID=79012 RepID=A0AAN7U0E3_9MYCE